MIQLDNISKSWDGEKTYTVRDVSLEVPSGQVLALLGGSGSGKSTTVKMINRLIEPTSGQILVNGKNVLQQNPIQLRRSIGYVFQGVGLFPHLSVADNVAVVLKLAGQKPEESRPKVEQLLSMVHLPYEEYGERRPDQLSGGQRQRVGFARAVATDPKVMLLDEPFGALDPVTRDSLQQEFLQLQKRLKLTAVMVTHDMAEALLLADLIAIMQEGKLLRLDSPSELMRRPGHPYVEALIETPRRQANQIASLTTA